MSGTLPEELSYFSDSLVEVNIGGGNIGGTIPSSLGSLSKLTSFGVSDNCLTGSIPEGLMESTMLQVVHISNNDNNIKGSFASFCNASNPIMLRDGVVAVQVDRPAVNDCRCCFNCDPDTFQCESLMYNATFPNAFIGGAAAYRGPDNYNLQFGKKCLTQAAQEWISAECPCVTDISSGEPGVFETFVCTTNCTAERTRFTNPIDAERFARNEQEGDDGETPSSF